YKTAREHATQRGIILADTKFDWGTDDSGRLILVDEVLTPDSSRFWPAEGYKPGRDQPSFDKQFVRDYLDRIKFDRTPPGPVLPAEIVAQGTRTADDHINFCRPPRKKVSGTNGTAVCGGPSAGRSSPVGRACL
ncbi:MAG: phosphoribosylaminoimidazolesuccinocarboxamide synthase, partial [Phycisphaerae bacterium]